MLEAYNVYLKCQITAFVKLNLKSKRISNSIRTTTSSEDSISDSLLDRSSILLLETIGAGGGGGGGGTDREVGRGGVGKAIRNGAGIFILFIKCKT